MKKIFILVIFIVGFIGTAIHDYYNNNTDTTSDSPSEIELTIYRDRNNLHLQAGARYGVEPLEDRQKRKSFSRNLLT